MRHSESNIKYVIIESQKCTASSFAHQTRIGQLFQSLFSVRHVTFSPIGAFACANADKMFCAIPVSPVLSLIDHVQLSPTNSPAAPQPDPTPAQAPVLAVHICRACGAVLLFGCFGLFLNRLVSFYIMCCVVQCSVGMARSNRIRTFTRNG